MRIGVLMGGISTEREISLKSGEEILRNINRENYDEIIPIIIDEEDDVFKKARNIDFALIALHGKFGEDGKVQGILEEMNIPYSGCNVKTSEICMNKALAKEYIRKEGINTADWIVVKSIQEIDYNKISQMTYPVFIKPNNGGSSVATFFIKDPTEVLDAVREGLKYDTEVIIEKFVSGEEISSFVLNGEVYPTISIEAKNGEFFDFNSKYADGGSTDTVGTLKGSIQEKVDKISEKIWSVLGCKSYSRIDMIISNNEPYVLEINTLPGMTKNSLIPISAKARGMEYSELIDSIIKYSLN
ncbi:D-alanine--D-alanine ligase [uncultured Clostridium sp.]|uniref:D-alanine--D-alanine ligase n=1 Tax=uncultured Clostridium sp. TaxID=59620 RepID=UPI002635E647|nr:D-alanine--D-alanine ligase [uncultured Clostridium sp.]